MKFEQQSPNFQFTPDVPTVKNHKLVYPKSSIRLKNKEKNVDMFIKVPYGF